MIRVLVDGVFFQLNNTGIARVWQTVLGILAEQGGLEILLLDRGGAPRIEGVRTLEFPAYDQSQGSAVDSAAIQKVCDEHRIDVFTSTYYTTPLSTPMLLVVYDMIPELFDYELRHRPWMEKQLALSYALRFVCISNSTRSDLLALYPEIPSSRATTAYCGVDREVFRPRSSGEIDALRQRFGLDREFFLFVGSRGPRGNYKNSWLFFQALQGLEQASFDVLCVGGEPEIESEVLQILPADVSCRREVLTDDELAAAYGAATALVYPSLYEGFGMPVIEAMASGCPVITTNHGSLAEAAGDAALLVDGFSVEEMRGALAKIRDGRVQQELRERGLEHAKTFSWFNMAKVLRAELEQLVAEASDNRYGRFFEDWRALRTAQARFDQVRQG